MTMNDTGIEAGGESPAAKGAKVAADTGTEPKKVEIEVNGNKVEMLEGAGVGPGDQTGSDQAGRRHQGELRSPAGDGERHGQGDRR